jgi:mRNA interferase RelE/StbE
MIRVYSQRFQRSFDSAPERVRKDCDKQLEFLLKNLRHPSLRAKKYDEARNLWQARVNKDWRFYFQIRDDVYYLILCRIRSNHQH